MAKNKTPCFLFVQLSSHLDQTKIKLCNNRQENVFLETLISMHGLCSLYLVVEQVGGHQAFQHCKHESAPHKSFLSTVLFRDAQ